MGGLLLAGLAATLVRAVQPSSTAAGPARVHGDGSVACGRWRSPPGAETSTTAAASLSPRAWRWTRSGSTRRRWATCGGRRATSHGRSTSTPRSSRPASPAAVASRWVKRQVTPQELAAAQRARRFRASASPRSRSASTRSASSRRRCWASSAPTGTGLEGLELAFEDELVRPEREGGRHARRPRAERSSSRARRRRGARRARPSPSPSTGRCSTPRRRRSTRGGREQGRSPAWLVVLDPRTGELLALAQSPRFNPNAPAPGIAAGALRDRPALDVFEPGSTYQGLRRRRGARGAVPSAPRSTFDCENGSWEVGRHVIHDTHPHGDADARSQSSQVSSNIGAAKVAQRLGREGMMRTARRFGFGERTGLALPGEGRGSHSLPQGGRARWRRRPSGRA